MKQKIKITDINGKVHEQDIAIRDLNILQARQQFHAQVFKNKKAYCRKEKYKRIEEYD